MVITFQDNIKLRGDNKNTFFREDGRFKNEIRRFIIKSEFPYTSLRQGNSHVQVKIDGPKEGSKLYFYITGTTNDTKRYYELFSIFDNILLLDSQLDIYVNILEEDGSLLSTIVNCIVLSICHSNIPLKDFPCSITYSEKGVDLSASEEGSGRVTVVYLMNSKKLVYYKAEGKITLEKLQNIDEIGRIAIEEIFIKMKEFLIK